MINVVENTEYVYTLPISVIVPLQIRRGEFFHQYVLPLIRNLEGIPAQVIIHTGEGNAAKKRNEGFKKATQPYVLFLDDDKLLPQHYLKILHKELESHPEVGFVYTGYTGIVLHPSTHPVKHNYQIPTRDFDPKSLLSANYIDTTSLMRREIFPGFDESLPQHDDWDMYCRIVKAGHKGMAVHGLSFFSFFLDEGITSVNNKDCTSIIRQRYA